MRGMSRQVVLALALASSTLLCAVPAEAGLMIATGLNFGSYNIQDESDDFSPIGGTVVFDQRHVSPGSLAEIFLEASPSALRVRADVTNQNRGGLARITGLVIFSGPSDPLITHALVRLEVDVAGTLERHTGDAGAGYVASMNFAGGFSKQINESLSHLDDFTLVQETLFIEKQVPLGREIPFFVQLEATAFGSLGDSAVADFGNSLTFDPSEFFTIKTPGVTANSADGDWLVNNQVAVAEVVPEPSSVAIWGLGAAGLIAGAWRKRRAR